jgi:hypothetical protein
MPTIRTFKLAMESRPITNPDAMSGNSTYSGGVS